VLDEFAFAEVSSLVPAPALADCLEAWRRVGRAVRVLMQITAGTFISEYTETVTDQGRRLDAFNRAIGHELRNVIGTLQFGAALLASEGPLDDTQRRRLGATVRNSADRAVRIIRSFERMPRSGLLADKPTEQTVELSEVVQEVFRQLRDMADSRDVELKAATDSTLVHLDTGALELILINLVANAVKYSDHAKARKHVRIEADAAANEHYELRVIDNGTHTRTWTASSGSKAPASASRSRTSASRLSAVRFLSTRSKERGRRLRSKFRRSSHWLKAEG
jgi:signal transduction histidine kinase